ncbi:MAG: alanine racemase [Gemmatimonadales bacterium]|nr:alanine racemase [Gemmatimonadales bacterium]
MLKSTSLFLRSLGITRPTVIVDEQRARNNIARMAAKARNAKVDFRPHFKTHQSAEIGRWFADESVTRITVSSLAMAEYFASAGWDDITLAFLLNPLEMPRLLELAHELQDRGGSLGVTIDSVEAASVLAKSGESPLKVWIKIDTGYGRTGVAWNQTSQLVTISRKLGPQQSPTGLLTHSGTTYGAESVVQIAAIHEKSVQRMNAARDAMTSNNAVGNLLLSIGDTPSCNVVDRFENVDEIRPGNFVFHDLMQLQIGSCSPGDLAVAVACPVVGIYPGVGSGVHPDRTKIVIHGGAVHFSKESLKAPDGNRFFGRLGTISPSNPPTMKRILDQTPVVALSQEHGEIEIESGEFSRLAGNLEIGDLVLIWPIHSCLTCDLNSEFTTLSGKLSRR